MPMKCFGSFTTAIFVVLLFGGVDVIRTEFPAPQKQLKTYSLPIDTKSADISPDEQLVVTVFTVKKDRAESGGTPYSDFIQLWNIKDEHLVAEYSAASPDVRISSSRYVGSDVAYPPEGLRVVRFSPDGRMVWALIGRTIHLLRSTDLTEMRSIHLVKPDDVTRTVHGKTFAGRYEIHSMELSPGGDVMAVLWVRETRYGKTQLYNLAVDAIAANWDTPEGWISYAGSLMWHPNGKLLLIAVPNQQPCRYANNRPDVFAFDAQTGAVRHELTTGLQVGGIAVTSDSRVLAVQRSCFQLSKRSGRQLGVFDLSTGKHLRNVSGRETGMHDSVSVSADGSRFLAFTGDVKTKFDWLDATSYGVVVDETFSVWNLANYDGIVTSQNIPGLERSGLRLSSKGKYAVSFGGASFVYELP